MDVQRDALQDRIGSFAFWIIFLILTFAGAATGNDAGIIVGAIVGYILGIGVEYLITGRTDE